MKLVYSVCLICLLPFAVIARSLPINFFDSLSYSLPVCPEEVSTEALVIPMAIYTVAEKQVSIGKRKFFQVSADVYFQGELLFGAGAVASGKVVKIENDADGQCRVLYIEMAQVQRSDGVQVALFPEVIKIETNRAGVSAHISAEVRGKILQTAYVQP